MADRNPFEEELRIDIVDSASSELNLSVVYPDQTVGLVSVSAGPQGPQGRQGVQGPPGNITNATAEAAETISGHRLVKYVTGGKIVPVDPFNPDDAGCIVGMTFGAAIQGDFAGIRIAGTLEEPSWNWIPNEPVFVGAFGIPTQTIDPGWAFVQVIGRALSPTEIAMTIFPPIMQ